ncbi:hypothetical protein MAR_031441, partial [Mya arenaria]
MSDQRRIFGVCIATEFVVAQNLMVNVVAINVFMTMFFNINISYGKFDSGILLWSFGVPFIGAVIAAMLKQFGPIGTADVPLFLHFIFVIFTNLRYVLKFIVYLRVFKKSDLIHVQDGDQYGAHKPQPLNDNNKAP